ncbi:hypothetical protein V1477_008248 [Vespula maculifrons]|uniref:Uncharacterized protein n=1 Tax=Vespula maculifrons TaxID=7453 RepID=A0ABD2CCT4_VESMC
MTRSIEIFHDRSLNSHKSESWLHVGRYRNPMRMIVGHLEWIRFSVGSVFKQCVEENRLGKHAVRDFALDSNEWIK